MVHAISLPNTSRKDKIPWDGRLPRKDPASPSDAKRVALRAWERSATGKSPLPVMRIHRALPNPADKDLGKGHRGLPHSTTPPQPAVPHAIRKRDPDLKSLQGRKQFLHYLDLERNAFRVPIRRRSLIGAKRCEHVLANPFGQVAFAGGGGRLRRLEKLGADDE